MRCKVWMLAFLPLLSTGVVACSTPTAPGRAPVPMPGPVVVARPGGEEQLYPPAVVTSNQQGSYGTVSTSCDGNVKTVQLGAYRTLFNYDDPSKSGLVVGNTAAAEALLIYPGKMGFTGQLGSHSSGASFTLYPTMNPSCGLARGRFEWLVPNIDPNRPGVTQKVDMQDMNFNPGATVMFADEEYSFPLIPGYVARGEGVRFTLRTSANPLGIEPVGATRIVPVQ